MLEREEADEEEEGEERERHTPFLLRRLVGRQCHVGPEGVLIGSGTECSVCLPGEAEVWEKHTALRWVVVGGQADKTGSTDSQESRRGSKLTRQGGMEECREGCFVLEDLTRGEGHFRVLDKPNPPPSVADLHPTDSSSEAPPPTHVLRLTEGVKFVTGRIEWSVTALPQELLLTHRMFGAARDGNLEKLRSILDRSELVASPHIVVTPTDSDAIPHPLYSTISVVGEGGLDVNAEFQPPSFTEDSLFNQLIMRRCSSGLRSHPHSLHSPLTLSSFSLSSPRLLLHIAIEQNHQPMVKYLLEKGANVRV